MEFVYISSKSSRCFLLICFLLNLAVLQQHSPVTIKKNEKILKKAFATDFNVSIQVHIFYMYSQQHAGFYTSDLISKSPVKIGSKVETL